MRNACADSLLAMNTQNPFSLSGKIALIAGASRGIGLAIGREVARAGARTILASRSLALLAEAGLDNLHHEATMLGAAKKVVELAGN